MDGMRLALIAGRAAGGESIVIHCRDMERAYGIVDEVCRIVDGTGVGYRAIRSNNRAMVSFDGGGDILFSTIRGNARGMSCDVFVLDDIGFITDEVAPIALLAKEKTRLEP